MLDVLVTAPYLVPHLDRFRPKLERLGVALRGAQVKERLSDEELNGVIRNAAGVIAGDDRFTREVFASHPELRVLSKWGTGIDSYDLEAADEFGVRVFNVPNAFSVPVSESIVGYALSFARVLHESHQVLKGGGWSKIPGRTLEESTVGIIGFGNVGQAAAQRFSCFRCDLLINDVKPIQPLQTGIASNIQEASLDQLLSASDFVCLCCDLNETSEKIINADSLGLMKKTAVLINCARGPLIDEGALTEVLAANEIAGAGLDVFEEEPLPLDSPLRSMGNVLTAPHNSNTSPRAWEATHKAAINNMLHGLGIPERLP